MLLIAPGGLFLLSGAWLPAMSALVKLETAACCIFLHPTHRSVHLQTRLPLLSCSRHPPQHGTPVTGGPQDPRAKKNGWLGKQGVEGFGWLRDTLAALLGPQYNICMYVCLTAQCARFYIFLTNWASLAAKLTARVSLTAVFAGTMPSDSQEVVTLGVRTV